MLDRPFGGCGGGAGVCVCMCVWVWVAVVGVCWCGMCVYVDSVVTIHRSPSLEWPKTTGPLLLFYSY